MILLKFKVFIRNMKKKVDYKVKFQKEKKA